MMATMDDNYRKPSTGMWDLMCSRLNGGVVPGGFGVWKKCGECVIICWEPRTSSWDLMCSRLNGGVVPGGLVGVEKVWRVCDNLLGAKDKLMGSDVLQAEWRRRARWACGCGESESVAHRSPLRSPSLLPAPLSPQRTRLRAFTVAMRRQGQMASACRPQGAPTPNTQPSLFLACPPISSFFYQQTSPRASTAATKREGPMTFPAGPRVHPPYSLSPVFLLPAHPSPLASFPHRQGSELLLRRRSGKAHRLH